MIEAQNQDRGGRPGKTRTWWHPLLVRLMDHLLSSGYTVQEEVIVGKLPLRVDILLVRREGGQLSESSRRDLSALVSLLNRFTLIEFKGPTDVLQPGDVAQLFGCAFLWHCQQPEKVSRREISLIVMAAKVNEALREELRLLECEICEHQPGVLRLANGPFTTWVVETDVMVEQAQPVLSLVSHVFLNEHERIIGELRKTGHAALLAYVLQQVQQFRRLGEGFAMQHADTQYLGPLEEELLTAVLQAAPVEKRLEGLSPEDRVRGLSPEEVLRRFTAEELAAGLAEVVGLTERQAAELRKLLQKRDH